jgi:hypothetical protein
MHKISERNGWSWKKFASKHFVNFRIFKNRKVIQIINKWRGSDLAWAKCVNYNNLRACEWNWCKSRIINWSNECIIIINGKAESRRKIQESTSCSSGIRYLKITSCSSSCRYFKIINCLEIFEANSSCRGKWNLISLSYSKN